MATPLWLWGAAAAGGLGIGYVLVQRQHASDVGTASEGEALGHPIGGGPGGSGGGGALNTDLLAALGLTPPSGLQVGAPPSGQVGPYDVGVLPSGSPTYGQPGSPPPSAPPPGKRPSDTH